MHYITSELCLPNSAEKLDELKCVTVLLCAHIRAVCVCVCVCVCACRQKGVLLSTCEM